MDVETMETFIDNVYYLHCVCVCYTYNVQLVCPAVVLLEPVSMRVKLYFIMCSFRKTTR